MIKTLLERFGIEVPRRMDDCNLIGLDFGDGELSAALAQWRQISGKSNARPGIKVIDLSLSQDSALKKNPNAYHISAHQRRLVNDARETELSAYGGGLRYYNFKKRPGTPEARSEFIKDDGSAASMTYEEVMAAGFGIAVRTLFESNPDVIERNKPTILLVGRPSSAGWESSELEYARLLESGLDLSDLTSQPVRVAIQSEAWAALARETDPNWGALRIQKGEVVVVLDNGSSTFDVTVISRIGLPENGVGEDSYQFGGNRLDENLLSIMQSRMSAACPGMAPKYAHGHKLGIRIKKQEYYGLDGLLQQPSSYFVTLDGPPDSKGRPPRFEFRIDESTMDEALEQIPAVAFHFETAAGDMVLKRPLKCGSWLDACRKIYQSFYQKMTPLFTRSGDAQHPKIPDRLILTGGVSVMPEVQKLAAEVFGVPPTVTERPNFSVSEGLAYVLGCEVRKAQYLQDLLDRLESLLPGAESLRETIALTGAEIEWDAYRRSLEDWAKAPGLRSIDDWYQTDYRKHFDPNLGAAVQNGAKNWYDAHKIAQAVNEMLQRKFNEMFGDFAGVFQYQLAQLDFSALQGVVVTIRTDYEFLFGQLTLNEEAQFVLSTASRQAKRDQAWRRNALQHILTLETKVKNGGTNTYHYTAQKRGFFGGLKNVPRSVDCSYAGLAAMYRKDITETVAQKIRQEIRAMLAGQMKEYVELITPYFNMTARAEEGDHACD